MAGALRGKVAVVTGAGRSMGKGVALGLGEAGATVYVTGRTVESGAAPFPGTVGETALAVDRLGGRGVAVRCDHREDGEVEALFRRVEEEHGHLDILVNNAFGQPPDMSYGGVPFWELPLSLWDDLHSVGLRSHYIASRFAAPLMIAQGHGVIVNISSAGETRFMFNVPYSVGKAAVARLTQDTARELRPHGVTVVALWPGLTRTELVMANPQLSPFAERVGHSPQLPGAPSRRSPGTPTSSTRPGSRSMFDTLRSPTVSLTSMAHRHRPARVASSSSIPPIYRPLELAQNAG